MRRDLYDEQNRLEKYYWWHIGKRKIALEMVEKYRMKEKKRKSIRILDLGCGTGMIMKDLKPFGEIWGVDNSNDAIQYCRDKKAGDFLIRANLEKKLPFEKNIFDVVICLDVLEHIKNENLVLSEMKRILKGKGIILVTVPAYPKLFSYWDRTVGHYRRYNINHLKDIFKRNNLKIEKMSYYNLFALFPAIIFRSIKSKQSFKTKNYSSDFIALPGLFNKFLLLLSVMERNILGIINLPAGLSILCLARKEET